MGAEWLRFSKPSDRIHNPCYSETVFIFTGIPARLDAILVITIYIHVSSSLMRCSAPLYHDKSHNALMHQYIQHLERLSTAYL